MTGADEAAKAEARVLTTEVAHQWQCDHFGHLNVRHYAAIFDDAIFVFWSRHGSTRAYGVVPVTAEMRTTFRAEVAVGTVATVRARIGRVGSKSVTVHLEMADARGGEVFATCEVVEVFFDLETRASAAIPEPVRESLAAAS